MLRKGGREIGEAGKRGETDREREREMGVRRAGVGGLGKTDRLLAQEKYVIAVATQCGNSPWQQQVAQGLKFAASAAFVCVCEQ